MDLLTKRRPLYGINGLALGWDQDFFVVCLALKIPVIAAVPFIGQELMWPPVAQGKYKKLLRQAYEVIIVSEGGYSQSKMQIRNQWMCDHANEIAVCWDNTPGGTSNCAHYAESCKNLLIHRIDPNDYRASIGAFCQK
jgi:uncharacterized phage-like protein YoqJ